MLVYTRVSKVGDRKDTLISDDVQEEVCRKLAEREGLTIVGEPIIDLDLSGREFSKRRISKSIERIRRREAEGIVVWKASRWGRNPLDSMLNVMALHETGGFIGSATENLDDIETPMGKFSLTQTLAIAQLQSDQIGETWMNIQEYRVGKGLLRNGHVRWGYVKSEIGRDDDPADQCSIHPGQGPWLRQAYQEFVAGLSFYQIVKEMRKADVTTNTGRIMQTTSLWKIMDSGIAAGLLVDRRVVGFTPSGARKTYNPNECKFAEGARPAIIDRDLWDRYVLRHAEKHPPSEARVAHRLSSLKYCAVCGRKLIIHKVHPGTPQEHRVHKCFQSKHNTKATRFCPTPVMIKQSYAEDEVLKWIIANSREERAYNAAIEKVKETERTQAALAAIDKRIEAVTKLRGRYLDMKVTAVDDDEIAEMDGRRAALKVELDDLISQKRAIESRDTSVTIPELSAFDALVAIWEHGDVDMVNEALRKVVKRVLIHRAKNGVGSRYTTGTGRVQVIGMWEDSPPPLAEVTWHSTLPPSGVAGGRHSSLSTEDQQELGAMNTAHDPILIAEVWAKTLRDPQHSMP
ncbi:recombinase family protein [Leucobacter sp. wl10]|uniref:recombinase family protein n=1 Tax=Leucobacter sp. wl10 TaxID=2304677 RepID=UPI0013C2CFB2|nr:recombinase family protein [Leucobacter sp. wl10]